MRSILNFDVGPWLAAAGVVVLPVAAPCQPPDHASLQAGQNALRLAQFEVAVIGPNDSIDLVRSFWLMSGLSTTRKEQLGLKLELQKRPVDAMYIDQIERPSPN